MRVCFCVHRLPYPPVSGGRTETYRLIEGLSERGHDIDVITFCDDEHRAAEMETESGATVHTVPGVPDRTPTNLVQNLFTLDPLPVMKARTDRFQRVVDRTLGDADILHLHALQTAYLAERFEGEVPSVIRFNNIKNQIYLQFAKYTGNPAKAGYAYLQYLKTKRYEKAISEVSDLVLAITEEDKGMLTEYGSNGNLDVLPAGVDLSRYDPGAIDSEERVVTFFGSMDYHPNEEGAVWFANEVFPKLRARYTDCTFEIVGKGPSRTIRRLGDRDGITVTGFVDDIREYIGRAEIIVLPIRVGTGIRMKALHAMAMGKPIVSTPIGIQGIRVEDGKHVSLADTPREFAQAIDSLWADPELRSRLGRNARALIEKDHDWDTIVPQLESFYAGLSTGESEGS